MRNLNTRRFILVYLCILFALRKTILVNFDRLLWREEATKREFDERVKMFEPTVNTSLTAPAKIRELIALRHQDGRERLVPSNYRKPFVFLGFGIPAKGTPVDESRTLLFLYSQGTVIWTGLKGSVFALNVTSCLVGTSRFPVIYDADGVYTCAVERTLMKGENLTLTVSIPPWKSEPPVQENQAVMRYLARYTKLEDGSIVLESDVQWNDGMMQKPPTRAEGRYKVCMMTQEKIFPQYIPEWIDYHRRIGVDYVYIYDNQANSNLSRIYQDMPDVEIVNWPWKKSQIQAQNHFLLIGRRHCQWGVLIDVDEYLMIRPTVPVTKEPPLKRLLRMKRELQDYSQIRVTSIALGSSGNVYRPREPMAEAYWHLSSLQDNLTKPIVWIGHTIPDSYVHHVRMAPGYYSMQTPSALDDKKFTDIALCHMKYRSWEDYVVKGKGDRNSFHVEKWSVPSGLTIHQPNRFHLGIHNLGVFLEFRKLWRRFIVRGKPPPELAPYDEVQFRYKRVNKPGFAWKRRRINQTTILLETLVEKERQFRKLKQWEIEKLKRFAALNKEVDL